MESSEFPVGYSKLAHRGRSNIHEDIRGAPWNRTDNTLPKRNERSRPDCPRRCDFGSSVRDMVPGGVVVSNKSGPTEQQRACDTTSRYRNDQLEGSTFSGVVRPIDPITFLHVAADPHLLWSCGSSRAVVAGRARPRHVRGRLHRVVPRWRDEAVFFLVISAGVGVVGARRAGVRRSGSRRAVVSRRARIAGQVCLRPFVCRRGDS